jgi:hypothetical protein
VLRQLFEIDGAAPHQLEEGVGHVDLRRGIDHSAAVHHTQSPRDQHGRCSGFANSTSVKGVRIMQAATPFLELTQLVYLFLFGGQLLGTPPGPRDAELIKSAPGAAYLYVEWSAAGEGQAGAPGLTGLFADPEIQAFVAAWQKSWAVHGGEDSEGVQDEIPRWMWQLSRHPGCFYLAAGQGVPGKRLSFPLEGALVLNLGDEADEFAAVLTRLFNAPQGRAVSVGGAAVQIEVAGPRLIVAIGEGCLERLHARWQQPLAELNDLPEYVNAGLKADVHSLGSITWVNLARVRDDLQSRLGVVGLLMSGVFRASGLAGIDSMMTVSGIEEHDLVSRTQITLDGPGNGLLTLFAGRPIAPADLAQVPADADFVAAVSVDLVAVHQGLRQMFAIRPEVLASFDEFQRQLELELKLSFADVLHGFGDVWTVYDAPSTGGVFLTGMVAAVPVNNPQSAQAVVRRLQDWLIESLPSESEAGPLAEFEFDGVTIHYLNSSSGRLSPAFCLAERQFLVALHPQAIKAHLRFLKSLSPRFDQKLIGSLKPPTGELLAGWYADTPRIAQAIYPVLPMVAKSVSGGEIDAASFPSAQAVLPYLRPASAAVVRRNDGLFIEQRNTAPIFLAGMLLPKLTGALRGSGGESVANGGPAIQLGTPEAGVVPANIEAPADADATEPSGVEKAARRTLPFFVRTWIPDPAEAFIPADVWQKMAQPPDPEQAAERAAERERRRAARAARRAARQGR